MSEKREKVNCTSIRNNRQAAAQSHHRNFQRRKDNLRRQRTVHLPNTLAGKNQSINQWSSGIVHGDLYASDCLCSLSSGNNDPANDAGQSSDVMHREEESVQSNKECRWLFAAAKHSPPRYSVLMGPGLGIWRILASCNSQRHTLGQRTESASAAVR